MTALPRIPGLLLAASLFWGWHADQLLIGVVVGALLELSRRSQWRWEFERSDLNRIADLCSLLLVATGIYLYATGSLTHLVMGLLEWSPILFTPLILAQLLGGLSELPLSVFIYGMRRRGDGGRKLDLYLPYVLLCLLAASVSASRDYGYYLGLVAAMFWLLWQLGGIRRHRRSGVALFLLAAALGYAGQIGMTRLQAQIEEQVVAWLAELFEAQMDPYQTATAIGEVGSLKFSDWVRYRVQSEQPLRGDFLLRSAAYNKYLKGQWFAAAAPVAAIPSDASRMRWPLPEQPTTGEPQRLSISARLERGSGLIPMPGGALSLDNLPVAKVERNRLGALRAVDGPSLVEYRVDYLPRQGLAGQPDENDLIVPQALQPLFDQQLATLALEGQPLKRQIAKVADYFDNGFTYSLNWAEGGESEPLAEFLLRRRSGHCEYYATSTTLLLRRLGIPARYVRGFSVQEYSRLEGAYVVRTRHSHAWSEYWNGASWQVLDTTPAVWAAYEEEQASNWQPLQDLLSWMGYRLTRFGQGGEEGDRREWLLLLIPLVVLLVWRLARQRRGRRDEQPGQQAGGGRMAADALLAVAERHLYAAGQPRRPGETLERWFSRIEREHPGRYRLELLQPLLVLHYRQRFAPQRLDNRELEAAHGQLKHWREQVEAVGREV